MSQENVEIVRRAFTAVLSRPPDWPTVNALFDSEHELLQLSDFIEGAYVGAEGYCDWRVMADQAGDWRAEIGDVRASPDGRVALQFRFELKGGRSGIVAERRMGMVVSI